MTLNWLWGSQIEDKAKQKKKRKKGKNWHELCKKRVKLNSSCKVAITAAKKVFIGS